MLTVISFLGVAILLTLMPGPDNLFVLAQSIVQGKNAGISTTLGLCTGLLVHVAAATIGISAVIYQSSVAFAVVKYAGAAYLLYLAYKSFRAKDEGIRLNGERHLSNQTLYKRGVIMNLLNPKVSLFFLALFPQFIHEGAGYVPMQMLLLGILFLIQALLIFVMISIFAGKVGSFLRRSPSISKKMNLLQGLIFAFIGLNMAFSQK